MLKEIYQCHHWQQHQAQVHLLTWFTSRLLDIQIPLQSGNTFQAAAQVWNTQRIILNAYYISCPACVQHYDTFGVGNSLTTASCLVRQLLCDLAVNK